MDLAHTKNVIGAMQSTRKDLAVEHKKIRSHSKEDRSIKTHSRTFVKNLDKLLVGVLIRFRKEVVAVQADIASMFYQVLVPNNQQKFLRFVYWPDGDLTRDLEDYQMCVHLFGAKSSTSCCIYALRRAALDNKDISTAEMYTKWY